MLVEGKEAVVAPPASGRFTHEIFLEEKDKNNLSNPSDGSHSKMTVERDSYPSNKSVHPEQDAERDRPLMTVNVGTGDGNKGSTVDPCSHDQLPLVESHFHDGNEETLTRPWTDV